jgi:hypothetical protein
VVGPNELAVLPAEEINPSSDIVEAFISGLSARVGTWTVQVQQLMDDLDRDGLEKASIELEAWLTTNGLRLQRNERARCNILLARIEMFFAGDDRRESDS